MRSNTREQKLQRIIETEKMLNEIQDVDVLLERLLTEARGIVRADAGSIYVIEGKNLKIKYAQNDTQMRELAPGEKMPYVAFSYPVTEKSISGYCVVSGDIVNIQDAYDITSDKPYAFNKSSDITTGYRTKSMLSLPLKTANGRTLGVLQIINAQDESGEVVGFDDDSVLYIRHFAASATQALEHAYLLSNMVKRMQRMAEYRDPRETYPHVERVSSFALEIYDRWAADHHVPNREQQKFRDTLKIAAKCHDLGKVGVSDVILKKTFPRFDEHERAVMKGHTCIGAMLFSPPESSLDAMACDIALYHHEWWDGSDRGYPGRYDFTAYTIGDPVPVCEPLKGVEIPLSARIVALADVFDALSHKRVYKEAWSVDDAFMEIQNESGRQFDPEIVKAFLQVKDRICAINAAYENISEDSDC
jgi:HD-GYP domain-containing protein (c-di-GMP phosphodiesterase class II)